jgi:hypothetical protein
VVATETVRRELLRRGFPRVVPWTRGLTRLCSGRDAHRRWSCRGRSFCMSDASQDGEALVRHYASAGVFVPPSRTETFGLLLLEALKALACGLPVAALPMFGPLDVIGGCGAGVLDRDLRVAALRALAVPRELCRAHALRYSWRACVEQFLAKYCRIDTAPCGRFCQHVTGNSQHVSRKSLSRVSQKQITIALANAASPLAKEGAAANNSLFSADAPCEPDELRRAAFFR